MTAPNTSDLLAAIARPLTAAYYDVVADWDAIFRGILFEDLRDELRWSHWRRTADGQTILYSRLVWISYSCGDWKTVTPPYTGFDTVSI